MDKFMRAAYEQAQKSMAEGGIPIGSVLVVDGEIVGRGHNQRVQKQSAILHAEMDAIENAGRLRAADYRRAVLYTTLYPCDMCSGTARLYRIPKIIIGENRAFQGDPADLRAHGVELEILDDPECIAMMAKWVQENADLWNEDIGE
ncbi:MAG: nucleoside deaminase [Anaerolineales bacterium]|nr:nucleoside deaminase [Anaerolineales bacterium]MCB8959621.1 nucleoside deaminase [Ardenticatenales bacterium]